MAAETQEGADVEPKNETVSFRVSRSQKRDVAFVAAALGRTESDLIHERVMPWISEEAERMRARLAVPTANEAA